MVIRLAGLALALAVSTTAQAAQQFDLECSGVTKPWSWMDKQRPVVVRYSIDLDTMTWCQAPNGQSCEGATKVVSVDPTFIVLRLREKPEPTAILRIDRIKAEFWEYASSSSYEAGGKCALAPFTPMPVGQF